MNSCEGSYSWEEGDKESIPHGSQISFNSSNLLRIYEYRCYFKQYRNQQEDTTNGDLSQQIINNICWQTILFQYLNSSILTAIGKDQTDHVYQIYFWVENVLVHGGEMVLFAVEEC